MNLYHVMWLEGNAVLLQHHPSLQAACKISSADFQVAADQMTAWAERRIRQTSALVWQVGFWWSEDFWLHVSLFLWQVSLKENVSQPDARASCLLYYAAGKEIQSTGPAESAAKIEGGKFTLWCLSALVISTGPVISVVINNTADVLQQKHYLSADGIPLSTKTLLCWVFAVAKQV